MYVRYDETLDATQITYSEERNTFVPGMYSVSAATVDVVNSIMARAAIMVDVYEKDFMIGVQCFELDRQECHSGVYFMRHLMQLNSGLLIWI